MTDTPRPWSTQPITGAQHDAWMAEERERALAFLTEAASLRKPENTLVEMATPDRFHRLTPEQYEALRASASSPVYIRKEFVR